MKPQRRKQFLKKLPIGKRFFLLILIASILPIMMIGFYSYSVTKSSIMNLSSTYNKKITGTIQSNIRLIFQNYIQIADELMLNTTVRNALTSYNSLSPDGKYYVAMDIMEEIRSKFTRIAGIFNIQIVTTENIPIYNSGFLFLDNDASTAQFDKIAHHSGNTLWYITTINNRTFVVLSRKVSSMDDKPIGYITIHIQPDTIGDTLSDYHMENISTITLIDSFNESYSFSSVKDIPPLSEETFEYIESQSKGGGIHSYKADNNYFISYTYSSLTGWTLLTATPYAMLNAPVKSIRFGILLMIALCILISAIVSHSIGRSITTPLAKMVRNIQTLSNSQLGSPPASGGNELEFLSDAYLKIINKMHDLTVQVQEEQTQKRKAEIKMLQAQINPHFLFNTLDSLKFTALMSNAPTTSEGLSSLSRILRNSIIDGNSYIPIIQEIKNIEDYITIQKIRYGEFIEFYQEVDQEVQHCLIMKFLLQPLAENSILHGLQEDSLLEIRLHIIRDNDCIHITLEDNGKGFDITEQYDFQANRFKSSKMSGIGLENVRQRLQLEYKSRQSFSINSIPGNGTTIKISFPATEEA